MRSKKQYIVSHHTLLQMSAVEISAAVGCTVGYVRRVIRASN